MQNIEQQAFSTGVTSEHFRAALLHGFVQHLVFLGDHGPSRDPFYAYDFPIPGRGVMRVTVTKPGENSPEAQVAELQSNLARLREDLRHSDRSRAMAEQAKFFAGKDLEAAKQTIQQHEHDLKVLRQLVGEQGRKLKRIGSPKKVSKRKVVAK